MEPYVDYSYPSAVNLFPRIVELSITDSSSFLAFADVFYRLYALPLAAAVAAAAVGSYDSDGEMSPSKQPTFHRGTRPF